MPITYAIDRSSHTVFHRFSGTVTFEQMLNNRRALLADPDFDPTFSHLIDARQVEEFALSKGQLISLALSPFAPEARRKAGVLAGALNYGLVRMYLAYSQQDESRARAFLSLEAACAWLGLDPDNLPEFIPRS